MSNLKIFNEKFYNYQSMAKERWYNESPSLRVHNYQGLTPWIYFFLCRRFLKQIPSAYNLTLNTLEATSKNIETFSQNK